jgi:16S rRNA (cytosine1402-N4)-methyltransferase
VFQALRIEVNDEIGRLRRGLPAVASVVRPGGRLGVLSFHRLEDREVKRFLADGARRGALRPVGDATPGRDEVRRNPRSRSARLRAAEIVRPVVREVA